MPHQKVFFTQYMIAGPPHHLVLSTFLFSKKFKFYHKLN